MLAGERLFAAGARLPRARRGGCRPGSTACGASPVRSPTTACASRFPPADPQAFRRLPAREPARPRRRLRRRDRRAVSILLEPSATWERARRRCSPSSSGWSEPRRPESPRRWSAGARSSALERLLARDRAGLFPAARRARGLLLAADLPRGERGGAAARLRRDRRDHGARRHGPGRRQLQSDPRHAAADPLRDRAGLRAASDDALPRHRGSRVRTASATPPRSPPPRQEAGARRHHAHDARRLRLARRDAGRADPHARPLGGRRSACSRVAAFTLLPCLLAAHHGRRALPERAFEVRCERFGRRLAERAADRRSGAGDLRRARRCVRAPPACRACRWRATRCTISRRSTRCGPASSRSKRLGVGLSTVELVASRRPAPVAPIASIAADRRRLSLRAAARPARRARRGARGIPGIHSVSARPICSTTSARCRRSPPHARRGAPAAAPAAGPRRRGGPARPGALSRRRRQRDASHAVRPDRRLRPRRPPGGAGARLARQALPGATVEITGQFPLLLDLQRHLLSTLVRSLRLTLRCSSSSPSPSCCATARERAARARAEPLAARPDPRRHGVVRPAARPRDRDGRVDHPRPGGGRHDPHPRAPPRAARRARLPRRGRRRM